MLFFGGGEQGLGRAAVLYVAVFGKSEWRAVERLVGNGPGSMTLRGSAASQQAAAVIAGGKMASCVAPSALRFVMEPVLSPSPSIQPDNAAAIPYSLKKGHSLLQVELHVQGARLARRQPELYQVALINCQQLEVSCKVHISSLEEKRRIGWKSRAEQREVREREREKKKRERESAESVRVAMSPGIVTILELSGAFHSCTDSERAERDIHSERERAEM